MAKPRNAAKDELIAIAVENEAPSWRKDLIIAMAQAIGISPDEFQNTIDQKIVYDQKYDQKTEKIKLQLNEDGVVTSLRNSYKNHREFYTKHNIPENVIRRGLFGDDQLRVWYDTESNSFNDNWRNCLLRYPPAREILKNLQLVEVAITLSAQLFPIMLTAARYLFQKLGLQAEMGITTNAVEQRLTEMKEILSYILNYKYMVSDNNPPGCYSPLKHLEWEVDSRTPLSILRQLPSDSKNFLLDENGNVILYKEVRIAEQYTILFLNLPKPVELPPLPLLKWTGKELVALHQENIPNAVLKLLT